MRPLNTLLLGGFLIVGSVSVFADATPVPPPSIPREEPIHKPKADASTYAAPAWDLASVDARLGPSYESLHPSGEPDDRPLLFKPESKSCDISFANRCNPYELGRDGCFPDNDYWSDSGQVAYIPDDPKNDPGLDRIQTYAYYNHVFALSPRLDYSSGNPHPDPQTVEPSYAALLGRPPHQPVAMIRNYGMLENEALVIYRDGLLAVAGTQTSRQGDERPYPGLVFPPHKVPTAIAVTSENEFALVTIWDTQTQRGQLAVIALEGKFLPYHTWPYMAFPNQGSFSAFKLLGYLDLPMKKPTTVSAATNGFWGGPSQTAGKVLGQLDLTNDGIRNGFYQGSEAGWVGTVATKGYAIVGSRSENLVAMIDLTPLVHFVRESYLSSKETQQQTLASRGPGPTQFPQSFEVKPEIMPTLITTFPAETPTAVLAGIQIDRWSQDRLKAYVAQEDGTIHILDTSSFLARFEWQRKGPFAEIGSFKVGRNPVSMVFTRFGESGLALMANGKDGKATGVDPLNNTFYVACRGDREVDAVVTWGGQGQIYRRIRDQRMNDPVAVSVAMRGYIVSVADFHGRKVMSFRIGSLRDRYGVFYGAGADGKQPFEFTGELSFKGSPYLLNSVNVN